MSFEQSIYVVEEEGPVVDVCLVLLDGPELVGPIDVTLTTRQSTARDGTDFEPTSILLQLVNIGEPSCVSIGIIDDDIMEEDEWFFVIILNSDNPNVQFLQSSVTVIIQDSRK